jgi:hypothetical protein
MSEQTLSDDRPCLFSSLAGPSGITGAISGPIASCS